MTYNNIIIHTNDYTYYVICDWAFLYDGCFDETDRCHNLDVSVRQSMPILE